MGYGVVLHKKKLKKKKKKRRLKLNPSGEEGKWGPGETHPSDHIWRPVIDLRLPSGKRRQGLFIEERPTLEVRRGGHLHALPVAVGAKGVPLAVVVLDEAGVGEVGVQR